MVHCHAIRSFENDFNDDPIEIRLASSEQVLNVSQTRIDSSQVAEAAQFTKRRLTALHRTRTGGLLSSERYTSSRRRSAPVRLEPLATARYTDVVKDIAEIRKLAVTERLQLVGEIWDSIVEDPDLLLVSDELAREFDARLAAHRADPAGSVPWEVVDREVFGAD